MLLLEEGKLYITRDGHIAGPMVEISTSVFGDGSAKWHRTGLAHWPNNDELDIMREYEPNEFDKRPGREEAVRLDQLIGTALAASVLPGYEPLAEILQTALDQAQAGKGKERHANGREFDRQPIMEIGRMVGLGYPTGQAKKKIQEAVGMFNRGEADRAVNELLGAIIYSAAAILLIREA